MNTFHMKKKMLKLVSEFLLMLKLESKYLSIPESKISGENWNILVVHYFSSLLFFIYHMWYNSRPKETRCDWIFHPHEMYQLSCEANKILCVWVHMEDYLYCSSTLEHLTYLRHQSNLLYGWLPAKLPNHKNGDQNILQLSISMSP